MLSKVPEILPLRTNPSMIRNSAQYSPSGMGEPSGTPQSDASNPVTDVLSVAVAGSLVGRYFQSTGTMSVGCLSFQLSA